MSFSFPSTDAPTLCSCGICRMPFHTIIEFHNNKFPNKQIAIWWKPFFLFLPTAFLCYHTNTGLTSNNSYHDIYICLIQSNNNKKKNAEIQDLLSVYIPQQTPLFVVILFNNICSYYIMLQMIFRWHLMNSTLSNITVGFF